MSGSGVQREGESRQAWAAAPRPQPQLGMAVGPRAGAGPGWLQSLKGKAHLGYGWAFSWKKVISDVAREQCFRARAGVLERDPPCSMGSGGRSMGLWGRQLESR